MYRSHLQLNGKSDDYQLNAIIGYLNITHEIPLHQIKKDWFISFRQEDYGIAKIGPTISSTEAREPTIKHRPDIMVLDGTGKLSCIIELDGSSHRHWRTKAITKRTLKRNEDYTWAKIPFIAIDIEDLRYLKKSWFEYLDEELEKIDMPNRI